MSALRLWGPVALYAALIFAASSVSRPPALPGAETDKMLHAAVYAGFALVLLRAVSGAAWQRVTLGTAGAAALLAAVYGVTDELHQTLVPGRSAELADLLADLWGALLGVSLAWLVARARRSEPAGTSAPARERVSRSGEDMV